MENGKLREFIFLSENQGKLREYFSLPEISGNIFLYPKSQGKWQINVLILFMFGFYSIANSVPFKSSFVLKIQFKTPLILVFFYGKN